VAIVIAAFDLAENAAASILDLPYRGFFNGEEAGPTPVPTPTPPSGPIPGFERIRKTTLNRQTVTNIKIERFR